MKNTTTRFLGTTDDVTTCDCCGKTGLKSTVALSIDGGDAVYFGVTCAARAIGSTVKVVRAETKTADDAREAAEKQAREEQFRAEMAAWDAWLAANAPGGSDRFTRIQALGGMTAARAAYKAALPRPAPRASDTSGAPGAAEVAAEEDARMATITVTLDAGCYSEGWSTMREARQHLLAARAEGRHGYITDADGTEIRIGDDKWQAWTGDGGSWEAT
jgi:hypothetical protein